ncbi:hypothetical protein INR49_026245 [Caranx melampygus]|nr:hypothetical protein INR49_026245 [Caranx melampygus]
MIGVCLPQEVQVKRCSSAHCQVPLSPEQIAREHGIRFFETSAKANINIEKAFLTLAEDILRKTPVKEPNSENVDISSGGGVTGWKSKCCS